MTEPEVVDPGVAHRAARELADQVRRRRPRAVARALSAIENPGPGLPALAAALAGDLVEHHVVGLTGSPGVGKSTTTAALVRRWRSEGRRVGVLAVDPSSPFTGGALLGDRIRMQDLATDPDVVIRSMATRGHLGGLSVATPMAVRVLAAAGCEVIAVETVGVGQSEVDVAGVCDTTVVLLAPGMGDGVQAAKAGVLEIADVFAVNKADRDGTQPLIRELRSMIALGTRTAEDWKPPIVATVASAGTGIEDLAATLAEHRRHAIADGSWERRRQTRASDEIAAIATAQIHRRLIGLDRGAALERWAGAVAAGRSDPYAAATALLADTDRTG